MNWSWASSLDQIWHSLGFPGGPASPTWLTFPMWLTLAAAGLFGIITLITLVRAEKSIANGALTVITLLAIGVALASAIREFGPAAGVAGAVVVSENEAPAPLTAASPALSCIDEMAGDTVLAACEKALFGSAESVAAAVSYTAARITRLTAVGDVAAADRAMTPDLQALRHSIERDRFGLAAYVLLTRDHCTPIECAAYRSLTDHSQIVANMDERVYHGLVARYALIWNAPPTAPAALGPMAGLGTSVPTGKPTNADFPSAASTPAVSIMTPEPATPPTRAPAATASASNAPPPATRSAPHPAISGAPTVAAAVRKPAPKPRAVAAPVQIAPAAPPEPPSVPAVSTD